MGASVTLRRRVQWMDTDAAGIWHHSAATRWMEEAETELHRSLGIISETFGSTPRVHLEFDFLQPLRFDDIVEVKLTVSAIRASSVEYEMTVDHGSTRAVNGRLVTVLFDRESNRRRDWPPHLRDALLDGRKGHIVPDPPD